MSVGVCFRLCLMMSAYCECIFMGVQSSMCSSRDFWGYQGLAECVSCSKMFPRDIRPHFVGPGCEGSVSMGEESA